VLHWMLYSSGSLRKALRKEAKGKSVLNGRCIFMDWTLYLVGLVLVSCAHDRTGLTYNNECMIM
jgi:hypothetical protein